MDDTTSIKSGGTLASAGAKRKRATEPKFYAVRSFPTFTEAERFVAGEDNPPGAGSTSSLPTRFYAVRSGRVPGIYTDWTSAQEQIVGWTKPKHKLFSTRAEAQRFLDEEDPSAIGASDLGDQDAEFSTDVSAGAVAELPSKKPKKVTNGTGKVKSVAMEYNEEEYEPGTGPLPPGAEDGFDPNIILDPESAKVIYKTQEQRQITKKVGLGSSQTDTLRIHTDGSSLGNGKAGAFAGIGVYFGPGDERNLSEALPGTRQTNQRAELTAILRALEIIPRNRDASIITDSKYAIDCVTSWYINWRKNGWRTAAGKPVENKDLVENILTKTEEREKLQARTDFEWIKGHSSNVGNEAADRLAVNGARKASTS
ncbi:MAG: hypothetical protein Q9195_003383 [Heterodermia aff. obscurata]